MSPPTLQAGNASTIELGQRKRTVSRWIEAAVNGGDLELAVALCTDRAARRTRAWVPPFRAAFPDVRMETVELVAEGNVVVGRFLCSGTHRGEWRGIGPTGRRFDQVDEVYFFRFDGERIADFWGSEDTASRLRQLGLAIG
jgi:predicted ester cyclase